MGALAASIAHEVNQPLMAIVTNAAACQQWLERDQPDLAEARKAAARVIRNGHLAGGVIRSVYQLAKRSPPKMTRLSVNAAIRETIDILRGQMSRHDVLLALDLRPDLPDVVGDKTQIQQLVLNLALNGIEAMASISGRTRHLRISSEVDRDGQVLVTVEDSGPGIDAQVMERLFEPLFTTKPEGMGMGLSICRSVIEAHGGRLWAAPKESGSLFLFTLPIEPNE
jgi:signal transduction histidine kinase